MLSYFTGAVTKSPRTEIALGTGNGEVNGIIVDYGASCEGAIAVPNATGIWKRLESKSIDFAGWTGPECPNQTYVTPKAASCEPYCLFRLDTDPNEHLDLRLPNRPGDHATAVVGNAGGGGAGGAGVRVAADEPTAAIAADLAARLAAAAKTGFSPNRGPEDAASCFAAVETYDGFWGPWVN